MGYQKRGQRQGESKPRDLTAQTEELKRLQLAFGDSLAENTRLKRENAALRQEAARETTLAAKEALARKQAKTELSSRTPNFGGS